INCDWSTALYIASIAHIPGLHFQSQNEYEYVWLQLMYQLFGFSQEKNSIGHIVKLKLPGRHNSPAYVKEHNGTFLRLITDRSLDTGVASFEIRNPRTQPEPFVPKRLVYAYGSWREKDGSLVLFSRDYKPLWRVRKNKHPERVSPWLWIDFVEQEHFWGDENCPWDSKKRQLEENQRLHCYGVKGLPMLSDVLPYALSSQATPRIDELIKMLAAERRVALADTIVGPFKPESIN
ncbi:MAG: hypothetical protein ACMZ66_19335, partial [Thalassospira sp.]|uniref:hypothetical protein n=1 Tax=Thalassospira sp. TaxID=1912094 RepID=UPI003A83BA4C